jgi:hypothetical protein
VRPDPIKAAELAGHRLQLDGDGLPDQHAHDGGSCCDGPRCVRCDQSWCYHCDPLGTRWGCQAGYGSTRNAIVWLALRIADKAERVARAAWREVRR